MTDITQKQFSIKELERFSGVKAHTLRVWERRYAFLKPERSGGNFRVYSLEQLKHVLDIALLKENGYRISTIACSTSSLLQEKLESLTSKEARWQRAMNDLTITMFGNYPEAFEHKVDDLLQIWASGTVVEKILFPFLCKTSLLWIGNKQYEEHIVVTAARKKIIYAIESLPTVPEKDKLILLFLPDTKQLDLGLLYSNYLLKSRGHRVLYLGNDITMKNFVKILQVHAPSFLFTYLPTGHHFAIEQLLHKMKSQAINAKLVIGNYKGSIPDFVGDNLVQLEFKKALNFMMNAD